MENIDLLSNKVFKIKTVFSATGIVYNSKIRKILKRFIMKFVIILSYL